MSRASANVFLIGPMGSGKTAVGRQLARLLRPAVRRQRRGDRERARASTSRTSSSAKARRVSAPRARGDRRAHARDGIVLATGGGAVLRRREPRAAARARHVSSILEHHIEQQLERTRHEPHTGRCSHDADPRSTLERADGDARRRSTRRWPTSPSTPTAARSTRGRRTIIRRRLAQDVAKPDSTGTRARGDVDVELGSAQLSDPDRAGAARLDAALVRAMPARATSLRRHQRDRRPAVPASACDAALARPRRARRCVLPDGEQHKTLGERRDASSTRWSTARFNRDALRSSRSAAASSATSPASPRPATSAASTSCRCRPRCSRRSTPRSAARPASIIPAART